MTTSKFIKAKAGPGASVTYFTNDRQTSVFSGGDRNWRNTNPGNLVPGSVSKRNGAIGTAAGFAIFPNYGAGHRALLDSLQTVHANEDLAKMIEAYAPPDHNETEIYLRFLRKKTGVKGNIKIKNFTSRQFEKFWRAIEQMEGTRTGKITELSNKKKITRARKNKKGTITAYYVKDMGWISKEKGIQLARQGKIDAVVTHSRSGTVYLKTRPDRTVINNLERMG